MSGAAQIQRYLLAAGLDALVGHVTQIESAIHDFIAQLTTPMEVSNDALYRYQVPKLSEDGACSLIDELDPTPYDLAVVLGGETEPNTRKLKLLNVLVTRADLVTGAEWVGIYQQRNVPGQGATLVKLAYRGRPSRAHFPLTAEFAERSTNSEVGLSGRARIIDDVSAHTATGGGFYVCDDAVQSEMCVPILDTDLRVLGIIDAEASPTHFFQTHRQCALVAMAMVATSLLP